MTIELQNLGYVYPTGDKALNNINLSISGTEPVAVIGQNGSGKTTLVKHFNGILRPTTGHVFINGEDVNNRSTAKWSKDVGYVFQNPDDQLFLETVRKEFEFGPARIGMPPEKISAQLSLVAKLCGLEGKLDIHPFDLAATDKKFCTIGAVLMMDPQIVVFDEPTCGQDVEGNRRLCYIIKTLESRGKLCITISHDMKFVAGNFKRVIVMCNGNVLLDGDLKHVFAEVETLRKSFVSPPPITRVAYGAGLNETVFTVDEFMKVFRARKENNN
ncbi:MAG TPA: ABC transporter [Treponema sp.]|nr:ABC transporter [Treponema sp.]